MWSRLRFGDAQALCRRNRLQGAHELCVRLWVEGISGSGSVCSQRMFCNLWFVARRHRSVEHFQAWRSTSRARQAGWPCERVTRRFVVEVARAEHGTALRGCRNSSPRARLPEGFCDHISERCQGRRDPLVAMPGKLGRNVKRRPSPAHGGALRLTKFACYSDSWQKCDAHGSRNALFNGLYA